MRAGKIFSSLGGANQTQDLLWLGKLSASSGPSKSRVLRAAFLDLNGQRHQRCLSFVLGCTDGYFICMMGSVAGIMTFQPLNTKSIVSHIRTQAARGPPSLPASVLQLRASLKSMSQLRNTSRLMYAHVLQYCAHFPLLIREINQLARIIASNPLPGKKDGSRKFVVWQNT